MPHAISPAILLKQSAVFALAACGHASGQAARPDAFVGSPAAPQPGSDWAQMCLREPSCAPRLLGQQRSARFWRREADACQEMAALCDTMRQAADDEEAAVAQQARQWWDAQTAAIIGRPRSQRVVPHNGIVQLDQVAQESGLFDDNLLRALRQAQAQQHVAIVVFNPLGQNFAGQAQWLLATRCAALGCLLAEEEFAFGQRVTIGEEEVDGAVPALWGIEDPFMLSLGASFTLLQQIDRGGTEEDLLTRLAQTLVTFSPLVKMSTAACTSAERTGLAPLCQALSGQATVEGIESAWLMLRNSHKVAFLRAFLQLNVSLLRSRDATLQPMQDFLRDPSARNQRRVQAVVLGISRAYACATNIRQLQRKAAPQRVVALVSSAQAMHLRRALSGYAEQDAKPTADTSKTCKAPPAA